VWIFTLLLATMTAVGLGVMAFTLPAFVFSFWVARRLTSRLERLTHATEALREGNLSARVVVEGEDEVARLQDNFNRMAVELENSTHALQAERDKVAGLLQVQRELIAGVSHELRTPAATILGYVDSLCQPGGEPLPETVTHDLEVIAHEAGRLRTILNDLLTLAQSESSRLSLNLEAVDVTAILQQAVQTLAPLAWETKRVEVTAEGVAALPLARADAVRVEQILLNLIQNAIRHTPPGGVVVLNGGAEAGQVWLEVADTGAGIDPQDLPHIWEKFFRGEDAPGDVGVGLGLALVKELSEAMGGSVSVESALGEGSAFRVTLPAA
jgi:signal transduction histidine kinase